MLVCLLASSRGFSGEFYPRMPVAVNMRGRTLTAVAKPFESLDCLRPELLAGVQRLDYTALTAIQARALPPALSGQDVVGKAKTGSGKTVVFGLALLQRLDLTLDSGSRPQALVLSPTRELAHQLVGAVRGLAVGLPGTRVVAVTGGATSRDQRDAIKAGAHVIVGTPGRVLAMLDNGYMDASRLGTLVLDEADSLLDMGFEEEVLRVLRHLPRSRQTLLFSATWPDKVEALSARVQSQPVVVSDGSDDGDGDAASATQVDRALLRQRAVLFSSAVDRNAVLCAVLSASADGDRGLAVVFCETKQQCRKVAAHLQARGASALALHGDLEQRDRDQVLVRFRNGSCRILVATNVAARGLDVPGIRLVVCYELAGGPGCGEAYTHRVGRTARASSEGDAVSLVAIETELPRLDAVDAALGGEAIPRVEWSSAPEYAATSGGLSAQWSAEWRTLLVQGGRRDKLRPGDVLGALSGSGVGLSGSDVGAIEVTEKRTWVAVRSSSAAVAAAALDRVKIKKGRFRVHLIE